MSPITVTVDTSSFDDMFRLFDVNNTGKLSNNATLHYLVSSGVSVEDATAFLNDPTNKDRKQFAMADLTDILAEKASEQGLGGKGGAVSKLLNSNDLAAFSMLQSTYYKYANDAAGEESSFTKGDAIAMLNDLADKKMFNEDPKMKGVLGAVYGSVTKSGNMSKDEYVSVVAAGFLGSDKVKPYVEQYEQTYGNLKLGMDADGDARICVKSKLGLYVFAIHTFKWAGAKDLTDTLSKSTRTTILEDAGRVLKNLGSLEEEEASPMNTVKDFLERHSKVDVDKVEGNELVALKNILQQGSHNGQSFMESLKSDDGSKAYMTEMFNVYTTPMKNAVTAESKDVMQTYAAATALYERSQGMSLHRARADLGLRAQEVDKEAIKKVLGDKVNFDSIPAFDVEHNTGLKREDFDKFQQFMQRDDLSEGATLPTKNEIIDELKSNAYDKVKSQLNTDYYTSKVPAAKGNKTIQTKAGSVQVNYDASKLKTAAGTCCIIM